MLKMVLGKGRDGKKVLGKGRKVEYGIGEEAEM